MTLADLEGKYLSSGAALRRSAGATARWSSS